jgi:chaperonin GroES
MVDANKFKPLGNRVLIKRTAAQSTKGGIILPDSAQEKPKQGEIVAIGEGKHDKEGNVIPMSLKIGDIVLFTSYSGTEVNSEEDKDYLIMSEEDVMAVIV